MKMKYCWSTHWKHNMPLLSWARLQSFKFIFQHCLKILSLVFQANTPQSIRESWSSALLLLFLYLGGAKKAAIAKHQVTYCLWCQLKIWITQFHGTKNINFICNSGPAAYSLPPVLGPKTVVTSAAPTYSLCGRDKTGSFHEDLQKVHFILYTVMKTISLKTFFFFKSINPVIYCCCQYVCFPSRVLALLPTKLWTLVFTGKNLPSTAWQAATSQLVKPHRNQALVHTILKRSSLCLIWSPHRPQMFSILLIYWHFSLPRWPSQKEKLQASPSDCVTHNTSHLSL